MKRNLFNLGSQPSRDGNDARLVEAGFVTVVEAATFLSLSRSTLYELMDAGKLPYSHVGRTRRIPKQALIDFALASLKGGWNFQG